MAKKFGKFLLFSLFAGAAAAGTYYYLKNKGDEDSFEDSEPDVNDDLEEFLKNESEAGPSAAEREYVPLNFSNDSGEEEKGEVPGKEEAVPEEKEPLPEEKETPAEEKEAPAEKNETPAEEKEAPAEEPRTQEPPQPETEKPLSAAEKLQPDIEKPLSDTAIKVSTEDKNIIGNPVQEVKSGVEKVSEPDDDRVSTFSFSSFD